EPCTMRDVNFFSSGRAIHDAIQTLANFGKKKFEIEKELEWEGISGHVDLVDTENNIPIECKSARVKTMDAVKPHYVSQLKAYMAILGSRTGVVLVQLLMHFDDKPFVEFEITMDDEEINTTKQKLLLDKEIYLMALEKKDPMLARGVVEDPDLNWLCKSCPHFVECLKNGEK
ncbi:MAG: Dna2/Cas4 domain-containing protein, partial [Thaumarchaeota archaeon]|nr:Dna2/Cas4 domain-containing protein [Nitrososphaerota archaeon]